MNKSFKKIFCFGLAAIIFLHANYLAFYYSLYLVNVHNLTENFCEKKSPCCNAHCYLDKKMNEESNGTAKKDQSREKNLELSEFYIPISTIISQEQNNKIKFQPDNLFSLKDFYPEIEHPPQI